MKRALALWVGLAGALAWAQVVPEREVEISKALFDAGNYAGALQRARDAMGSTNFTDAQRVELHRLAALSAFNLGDAAGAQGHFLRLLTINPDFVLDPFVAPPPAVKLFEQVRRDNADALGLIRQQLALRADQDRRISEARTKTLLESQGRTAVIRTIEKRSLFVNFLPFGAGQFQQGRVEWGVAFAIAEGLTALASIIGFWALEGLYVEDKIVLNNVLTKDGKGTFIVPYRRIPQTAAGQALTWSWVKYASGFAFYALWAVGAGEALWHHQPNSVTEHQEPLTPAAAASKPAAGARLYLFPLPQGAGAGVTVSY